MSDPCKQEGNIGALQATVEAIKETLEKIGEGQERFVQVLEKIAAQGTEINTLKSGQNLLFERVREIEIKVEGERNKLAVITGGISAAISAAIAYFSGR